MATMNSSSPSMASADAVKPSSSPSYFTFKDYLSKHDQVTFFDWPHSVQVAKVAEYLEFVSHQPAAAQFTSSKRASTSWAKGCDDHQVKDDVLLHLLEGRTKSGFGVFGSEEGFLPQKELSLAVAHSIEPLGHEYIVERTKTGALRPRVLNSRSFYLNWCHAEKQKLIDIRLKLDHAGVDLSTRCAFWERLVVVVDRVMCPDCINYAHCLAVDEQARITVRDPVTIRVFPPQKHEELLAVHTNESL